ncbi:TIGR01244 family phosphatase [Erythrobacter insulae]|uniref:TIGR01244 family phosphatase n=1 Tax=Erythrobacter insulae TaxID=2584124 RepID=A0A547PBI9_9SPHN|nr:TIGR01244 family sulfur transferase [Erythrobacter insulae]TRD11502.1 TIGR01244 family phosphatase [Erythrobacter insulae]
MTEFRKLTDTFYVSEQIDISDVEKAKADGFALIVNNRPDGEDPGAAQGQDIREAAEKVGIGFLEIPITHAGFSLPQIDELVDAITGAGGPETAVKVLGYCRSGTRSSLLWALAQAKLGKNPEVIEAEVEQAGYSVAPVRPTIDMLAQQSKG